MIELANNRLRISLLDPSKDRHRLGPRFCAGGYIYQVEDRYLGPLLSGPEFPSPNPSVINGQGMPDVFQFTLFRSPDEIPPVKLIIGVGKVENRQGKRATESHFDSAVESFAHWTHKRGKHEVTMATSQELGEWSLELRRNVLLRDSGWSVTTEIRSTGRAELPFRWFTHPFFPLNSDFRCCTLPADTTLDANPGFLLQPDGVLRMRREFLWTAGCYTHIRLPPGGSRFTTEVLHPAPCRIRMELDLPPSRVALWANAHTFSLEPFVERTLLPGESARWAAEYTLFPE